MNQSPLDTIGLTCDPRQAVTDAQEGRKTGRAAMRDHAQEGT